MSDNITASHSLDLEDFEYDLPQELIAQEPPPIRHASRLMHIDRAAGTLEHRMFADLPHSLRPGDLLVVNDTKVIPARLMAKRKTGASVEILLLKPEAARPGVWLAMAAPLRKLNEGESLDLYNSSEDNADSPAAELRIDSFVIGENGQRRVLVDFGSQENVYRILSQSGLAPLPPYIRRMQSEDVDAAVVGAGARRSLDLERYQTVFARVPGAVAAPTAGLHFSESLFAELAAKDIAVQKLTLHVGAGTFKPITSNLSEHSIESERFVIEEETAAAINLAISQGRRIIAVGTTSCRALETAGASGLVQAVATGSTSLYIRPGYKFQVVSCLITNFHLSRSSLLVLVSTFAGHSLVKRAYQAAVDQRYRFFSYGDAMLIT